MRVFLSLLFSLILFCHTAIAADFSNLIILHTNDTHGYDIRNDTSQGLATIAELKNQLEKQGYSVLLLDAGDCTQDNTLVNYSKGKAAIEFYNAARYDGGCLGNHEFDYGVNILKRNVGIAQYPILSSNVIVNATGNTLVPASAIINKDGLKIGIVGFTTPGTMVSTIPKNVAGLTFLQKEKLYSTARAQVKALQEAKCDLIIGVGHMGSNTNDMGNRSDDICANVDGMAIFIDGHDHLVKNRMVNNTLLVEAGQYTRNIGYISYKNGQWTEDMLTYGQFTGEAPEVKQLIDKEKARVDKSLGQVVGISNVILNGERVPGCRTMETNSGDFYADAFLWAANRAHVWKEPIDIAILNGGGIRATLKDGIVTRNDILSANPFNNQLFVIKLTGAKLLEILEAATAITPEPMGDFPQVAGMKYTINTKVPYTAVPAQSDEIIRYKRSANPGSRVTITEIGGKPFNPNAVYTMATHSYIVSGAHSYAGLLDKGAIIAQQSIGCIDNEAIEAYITECLKGRIGDQYKEPQGRIVIQ